MSDAQPIYPAPCKFCGETITNEDGALQHMKDRPDCAKKANMAAIINLFVPELKRENLHQLAAEIVDEHPELAPNPMQNQQDKP